MLALCAIDRTESSHLSLPGGEPACQRRRHGSRPWPGKAPCATGQRTAATEAPAPYSPSSPSRGPCSKKATCCHQRGSRLTTPGAKLRGSKDQTMSGQQVEKIAHSSISLKKKTATQQPGPNQRPPADCYPLSISTKAQAPAAGQSAAHSVVAVPASSARQWEADRLRGLWGALLCS